MLSPSAAVGIASTRMSPVSASLALTLTTSITSAWEQKYLRPLMR